MKWSQEFSPNENCRYNHVVYKCPILGDVCILWKGWKEDDSYDCHILNDNHESVIAATEYTLKEAKESVEVQLREKLKESLQKVSEK